MKGSQFEFRFRMPLMVLCYVLGFEPWSEPLHLGPRTSTWAYLSGVLARPGFVSWGTASIVLTVLAIVVAWLGAWFRVWGTAYIGGEIMVSQSMIAEKVVTAGPYKYLRNPLYLGFWLVSLPVMLLMPPSGALFALIVFTVFILRLIGGEEAFLTGTLGADYTTYRSRVPSFVPSLTPRIVARTDVRPNWLRAIVLEAYSVGMAIAFSIFAWRYDSDLLTMCVLIAFGVSLVLRALFKLDRAG